jgi:hypothetical protein
MLETHIAGYDYGKVGRSPLTLNDLERLQETAGFTEDDRRALDQAADILEEEAESHSSTRLSASSSRMSAATNSWRAGSSVPTASRTIATRRRSSRASCAG